jgi:hypothetical protein
MVKMIALRIGRNQICWAVFLALSMISAVGCAPRDTSWKYAECTFGAQLDDSVTTVEFNRQGKSTPWVFDYKPIGLFLLTSFPLSRSRRCAESLLTATTAWIFSRLVMIGSNLLMEGSFTRFSSSDRKNQLLQRRIAKEASFSGFRQKLPL